MVHMFESMRSKELLFAAVMIAVFPIIAGQEQIAYCDNSTPQSMNQTRQWVLKAEVVQEIFGRLDQSFKSVDGVRMVRFQAEQGSLLLQLSVSGAPLDVKVTRESAGKIAIDITSSLSQRQQDRIASIIRGQLSPSYWEMVSKPNSLKKGWLSSKSIVEKATPELEAILANHLKLSSQNVAISISLALLVGLLRLMLQLRQVPTVERSGSIFVLTICILAICWALRGIPEFAFFSFVVSFIALGWLLGGVRLRRREAKP